MMAETSMLIFIAVLVVIAWGVYAVKSALADSRRQALDNPTPEEITATIALWTEFYREEDEREDPA